MAEVTVTGTIQIGDRVFPVKKTPIPFFLREMVDYHIEATTIQTRVLSYWVKDYIIDKLLAYRPSTGERIVKRIPAEQDETEAPPEEPKEQQIDEPDPEWFARHVPIPKRESDPPKAERIPFPLMPPLSKGYLRSKIKRNLDARILISSGDYLRGIVVRKRTEIDNSVSYLVTMANRKHRFSNLSLQRLALIQEFGTSSYTVPLFGDKNNVVRMQLPPRPHWRPAVEQLLELAKDLGPQIRARALRLALSELE